jgi:hypothetical protein
VKILISLAIIAGLGFADISYSKCSSFSYEIKYNNRGTRSEGRTGVLYFKGSIIKNYFDEVLTDLGTFTLFRSLYIWSFRGYKKTSKATIKSIRPTLRKGNAVFRKIIKNGYYEGRGKILYLPENWIRVKIKYKFYWVNPDRLDSFIRAKRLKPRSTLLQGEVFRPAR